MDTEQRPVAVQHRGAPRSAHVERRRAKPLFGLRRGPGRIALALFRLPLPLYQHGWGRLLGDTFLLLVHVGRKTGEPHSTVAMTLSHNPNNHEAVICSAWGEDTDWIRNIRAAPARRVQIGRESYVPEQRFLSEDESFAIAVEFRRRHPWRLGLLSRILGWDDLRSNEAVRAFVRSRPFVAFRPSPRNAMSRGSARAATSMASVPENDNDDGRKR